MLKAPGRNAGAHPFVFQRIAEPAGIAVPVSQIPFRLRQAAQERGTPRDITDLACGHEKADPAGTVTPN